MKVNRIVCDIESTELDKANAFYRDILGLELMMDHGWIRTYGSGSSMPVQISFASEGGSGTAVPDLSIEVDQLDVALSRVKKAVSPLSMGRLMSPGVYGGFMFETHLASC